MRKLERNCDALGFGDDTSGSSHVAGGHCRVVRHCSAGSGVWLLELRLVALGKSTRVSSSAAPDHKTGKSGPDADRVHSKSCGSPPRSPPPADEGSRQDDGFRGQSSPSDLTDPSSREDPGASKSNNSLGFPLLAESRSLSEALRLASPHPGSPRHHTSRCLPPTKHSGRRPRRRRSVVR